MRIRAESPYIRLRGVSESFGQQREAIDIGRPLSRSRFDALLGVGLAAIRAQRPDREPHVWREAVAAKSLDSHARRNRSFALRRISGAASMSWPRFAL